MHKAKSRAESATDSTLLLATLLTCLLGNLSVLAAKLPELIKAPENRTTR